MAWSSSSSPPVSMEAILARIARLEARLEAKERRCSPVFTPSRAEANPPFGMPCDWRVPTWDPGSHPTTTQAATTLATSLPAVQHQPLPAYYDAASPPFCHPSRHSWRPLLPQQVPWDSPWLRSNHKPSHAPQPSPADIHAPWESPWSRIALEYRSNRSDWEHSISCVSDPPPSHTDFVPCSIEPEREKRERGLAPFSLGLKVVDEEGDSKTFGAAEDPSPNSVNATSGPGSGGDKASNVVQSSAAVTNDDVREKTLGLTDELMACEFVVAKEGDDFVVAFAKEGDELERASAHSHFGWAVLYQAQEEAVPFGFIPNKKGAGSGKKRLKSREVSRRLVVFGFYALEEVYKDLSNFHLEDKVVLKGGGVDTLI